jgi:hypothetical protein
MAPAERIKDFRTFYKFYLTEHSHPVSRALHFFGTTWVFVLPVLAIVTQTWWLFALIPVVAYGFAWIGHFFFERNKPATFQYPFWSLGSDFVMYFHTITGQLPRKMREAREVFPV